MTLKGNAENIFNVDKHANNKRDHPNPNDNSYDPSVSSCPLLSWANGPIYYSFYSNISTMRCYTQNRCPKSTFFFLPDIVHNLFRWCTSFKNIFWKNITRKFAKCLVTWMCWVGWLKRTLPEPWLFICSITHCEQLTNECFLTVSFFLFFPMGVILRGDVFKGGGSLRVLKKWD